MLSLSYSEGQFGVRGIGRRSGWAEEWGEEPRWERTTVLPAGERGSEPESERLGACVHVTLMDTRYVGHMLEA